MPPTLESKDSGINFHGLLSLAHKRFTQTIFNALSNNVKSNILSPPSFLFLIIVVLVIREELEEILRLKLEPIESSLNFKDDEHRKLLETVLVLRSANKMDVIF